MNQLKQFKIRASATSKIMAYPEKNEVPKGALTYLHEWVKEQLYERSKEFSSKYTEKGTVVEETAINFASDVYGWGLVSKNEKNYHNEWMTGTPDLVLADLIPDLKSSWDCFTFPLFGKLDPDYEWQMQTYMDLTGKENAAVIYTLQDAPDMLVESEARKEMWKAGLQELEMELYDQVKATMTYSHLPTDLRIKRFDVKRDDKKIKQVHDRVSLCAEYIASLNIENYLLQLKQTA